MYPIDKYRYYRNGNKVIAVSTYAGKTVRGVAVCDSGDEFDLNKGKNLAAARCAVKIAEKRCKRADAMVEKAEIGVDEANARLDKMEYYRSDAIYAMNEALDFLNNVLEDM